MYCSAIFNYCVSSSSSSSSSFNVCFFVLARVRRSPLPWSQFSSRHGPVHHLHTTWPASCPPLHTASRSLYFYSNKSGYPLLDLCIWTPKSAMLDHLYHPPLLFIGEKLFIISNIAVSSMLTLGNGRVGFRRVSLRWSQHHRVQSI